MNIQIPIHVTQEHIDNGKRDSCIECPIASAVYDATGGLLVNVDAQFADRTSKPKTVRRWIGRFDDGLVVRPIDFTLELRIAA